MDFNLNKTQELFRQMIREFAEKEVKPLAAEIDEQERFPQETVEKMAKLGIFGIPVPKQYGGGIDVSKPGEPIINKDILKNYFAKGGQFYLLIHIGNQTRAIEVKISGSIGIADRSAEFVDDNDNHIPGFDFKGRAMASNPADDGSIALNQMVPLYPYTGDIASPFFFLLQGTRIDGKQDG